MSTNQSFRRLLYPLSLSFRDKKIEEDYADYYRKKIVGNVRIAMVISIGLYSVFSVLDVYLFPEFKTVFLHIRIYFVVPFMIIVLVYSYYSSVYKYLQPIIAITSLVAAYGIIAMSYIGGKDINVLYYVGLMLIFIFSYDFLKLRFTLASSVGALVLIGHFFVSLLIDVEPSILATSLFFLVSANIMGMVSCYFYESLSRQFYFSQLTLEKEKRKTEEINLNLEAQVLERTSSLEKTNKELFEAKVLAEDSEYMKSVFLATMSHELRTPLNAIIGFSDIINSEENDEQENKEYAQIINKSGTHLLSLVESLFDITLIDSGQVKLSMSEYSLFDILADVNKIMLKEREILGKDDVDLKFHTGNIKTDIRIYTDGSKIKQVLINLLKNAIKFTESGSIEFWCEEIEVQNKSLLKFYVQDTGIGIPKEKIDLVFDVFRQVDDTHSRKHGGVGIGLTVVRKLVNMLDGEVGVDSDEDKGSLFYFTIGNFVKKEDESKLSKDIKNLAVLEPLDAEILIVEDDDASYYLLEFLLQKREAKIKWAKNGEMALEMLEKFKRFDLILMDINLPFLSGYDASIRIKELYPDQIIIAQTAYAVAGDKEKALASGCDAYITKPISEQKLNKIISEFI